jgi:hypothetical protein
MAANSPGVHDEQELLAVDDEKVPVEQGEHIEDPDAPEKNPTEQVKHAVPPLKLRNEPDVH